MHIKNIKIRTLALGAFVVFAACGAETRYGLFVGVNEFDHASSLSACDWDAARMYDAYTTGGTCASTNASLFVNRKAKKEDVRAKFSELAGKAKSGDTVLYYQSSHGGSGTDADGNATADAYLCLTDADYSDVEFAEDLQRFKDGVNVVVVLDACFSGGMFKAAGAASATDLKRNGWNFATRVRKLMSRRKTSTKAGRSGPSIAFVTAANWDETSSEIGRQGEFTGAFLDGWADAAAADADADGKVTFAELAEYAKPVVENSSVQTSNDTLLKSIVAGHAFDTTSYRLLYADGVLAGFFGTCPSSVTVADGTTEICWSAFDAEYNESATNLTSVTIPASVTKIGQWAFYGCGNLEAVEFEGDFAAIDCPRGAFEETPVRDTLFPPPVNDAFADAIVLSGASGTTNGWNYLATNTDAIDELADLGKATVWWAWTAPETDTYEFNTFGSHFDTMIAVLKHIEDDGYGYEVVAANDDAGNSGYNESAVYFNAVAGVTYYIGVSGYDEEEGDITLNWKKSVFSLTIEDGTLVGFTGLCPATLDLSAEPIAYIDSWAFEGCSEIQTLVLPESLASIGNGAFYGCENLEAVVCANTNWQENVEVDVDSAFESTPWRLGPLEMTVDEDGTLQVSGFVKGDIVIPEGTKTIPESAFNDCHRLTSVIIPASVTSIGSAAFYGCTALTNVIFKSDDRLADSSLVVGDNAFAECYRLVSVVVEPRAYANGVDIESSAFCNCRNLVELDLGAVVCFFEADSIDGCDSLAEVNIAEGDQEYVSIDGMVYNRWADVNEEEDENGDVHVVTNAVYKYLVRCPEGKSGFVKLDLDVCEIYDGAFRNCTKLDKVQLPETFEGMLNFDSVFEGCDESIVEYYEVPHKVVTLDFGYDGLALAKKVSTDGGFVGALPYPSRDDYEFRWWNTYADGSGRSVYGDTFAAELEGIDTLYAIWEKIAYTFNYNTVAGGAIITGVSPYPRGCVEIPEEINGLKVIGIANGAFNWMYDLKRVRIPVTVTAIENSAFSYCDNLATVELPETLEGVLDIDSAFYSCGSPQFTYYEVPHFTITLDANGGTLDASEVTAYVVAGNLPVPVREGYDFMGWWTDAEGGEWISPDREVSADFTAYAHWQESEYNWSVQDYTDDSGNVIGVSITTGNWSPALSRIDGGAISGAVTVPYGINGQPVVAIGYCAFVNCSAIAEAVLPPTVQRIGNYAFDGCSGLLVVDIPDGVRYIDDGAFSYSGIESVFIPASVNSIAGGYVFGNCRYLSEILVDESSEYYKSVDGVLYTKDGTTLVAWPGGRGGDAAVAEGTRTIGNYAFAYSPIVSVSIPNGVERIEHDAFASCFDLTAVDIPSSVTYIGSNAFAYSGLLPEGVAIGNQNATVESTAFRNTPYEAAQPFSMIVDSYGTVTGFTGGCPETIDIGAEAEKLGVAVTAIGYDAFYGYNQDMTPLKSVVIPEGVTNVSNNAFYYCSNLESVTLPGTLQNIGSCVFEYCQALREILIPASVENIGSYAFAYCNALETAYVPARIESVVQDANVFDGNDNVRVFYYDGDAPQFTSVTLKMNDGTDAEETVEVFQTLAGLPVPRRQDYTFTGWWTSADESGEAVADDTAAVDGMILYAHWTETVYEYNYYDNGNGVTLYRNEHYDEYGNWYADPCVSPKPYGRFAVPSEIDGKKVTRIDYDAFYGCDEMTEIVIPASVSYIDIWAFNGCTALERIMVDEANPYYKSIDGVLYTKNGEVLVFCPRGRTGAVVVADGTREIGDSAVYNCDGIESVEIPDSVEYIAYQAFAYCDNFATVSGLNETNMYVAVNAFANTPFERSRPFAFVIENGAIIGFHGAAPEVLDIGEHLGGEVVTGIGSQAFSTWGGFEVGSIRSVVVPEGVTRIEYGAFAYCGMASITLPSSLVLIGNDAFYGCSSLRRIRLPENVEEVSGTAFNACYNLTLIEAPKTLMGKITSPYGRIEFYDVPGFGVTLDANGGVFADGQETYEIFRREGAALGELPLPAFGEDDALAFAGWWTTADDSGEAVVASYVPAISNLVLYAHWVESPFAFGGDACWVAEGGGVWRSGKISHGQSSSASMFVVGPAEVSFKWKTSSEGSCDRLHFAIDADYMSEISGMGDWEKQSFAIETAGEHVLKWEYVKDGSVSTGDDCGWIKDIVIFPVVADGVTVDVGGGKTVTIPRTWIEGFPALVKEAGGDVEAALLSTARNGQMSVAACYVLGLDPEVSTNGFRIVSFPMNADGAPDLAGLEFEPRQEEWNVPEARPVIKGVENLGDDDWTEVDDQNKSRFRFFKVDVELP